MESRRGTSRASGSRNGRIPQRAGKRVWMFDFDNTIARLEPEVDWAGSRRELEPMLRAAGVPEDLFEKHPRGNILLYDDTRARLLELARDGSRAAISRVRAIIRGASKIIEKHELAGVDRAQPLEGAIELMRELERRGAKIAIVTSNSSRTIRRWLRVHRLRAVVDTIVGRDSYLALKPSPETLERAGETRRAHGRGRIRGRYRFRLHSRKERADDVLRDRIQPSFARASQQGARSPGLFLAALSRDSPEAGEGAPGQHRN